MDRKILDDQLKLFEKKENEIYQELKKLDEIENGLIEEADDPKNYELKNELPDKIKMIEEARSDLRGLIGELRDHKKKITFEFEVTLSKLRNKKYKLQKEAKQKKQAFCKVTRIAQAFSTAGSYKACPAFPPPYIHIPQTFESCGLILNY